MASTYAHGKLAVVQMQMLTNSGCAHIRVNASSFCVRLHLSYRRFRNRPHYAQTSVWEVVEVDAGRLAAPNRYVRMMMSVLYKSVLQLMASDDGL